MDWALAAQMARSIQIALKHEAALPQCEGEARPAIAGIRARVIGGLLLLGCGVAGMLAATITEPRPSLMEDAELARLLRGMAVLKAGFVLAAVAGLLWRLRWPLSNPLAAGYLSGVWLASAASVQIWQLGAMATAASLFHAGLLIVLVSALCDGRERSNSSGAVDSR